MGFFRSFQEDQPTLCGYAKCPDVCPVALSYSAQAIQQLSPGEAEKIQFIFISVDAAHDTAEAVATYAKQFHPHFIGLTGAQVDIDKAVRALGASYLVEENKNSYLGYSIAHTDRVFILSKKGYVIDTVPSPRSADEILVKIKLGRNAHCWAPPPQIRAGTTNAHGS